jgi:hypothetical protein
MDAVGEAGGTTGSGATGGTWPEGGDGIPPSDIVIDVSDGPAFDASDGSVDNNGPRDSAPTVDAGVADVPREPDAGTPIGPQTLPLNGIPMASGTGTPFESECNADEVVTGFNVRQGASTDAIGAICSKYMAGTLSSPRSLPMHGHPTGGTAERHECPSNYVAAGVVGKYGRNTSFDVDALVNVGIACRSLANPTSTQIKAVTSQPTMSGATSFREDCSTTRMLTSVAGRLGNNYFGIGVHKLGGECNPR